MSATGATTGMQSPRVNAIGMSLDADGIDPQVHSLRNRATPPPPLYLLQLPPHIPSGSSRRSSVSCEPTLNESDGAPERPSDIVLHSRGPVAQQSVPRANGANETVENPGPNSSGLIHTVLARNLTPGHKIGPAPTPIQSLQTLVRASYLNVLLAFVPISWSIHFLTSGQDTMVFVFSSLALLPLAKLLAFVTEDLSIRLGQTLASLLNVTFGNAVEFIVAIVALKRCQLRIVQSSLLGAILGDLLFVLGACFFFGGLKYSEQGFGHTASQLNASLLTISVASMFLPTAAYYLSIPRQGSSDGPVNTTVGGPDGDQAMLLVSHGAAIILLLIYFSYLWFSLYSHASLYDDTGEQSFKGVKYQGPDTKEPSSGSSTFASRLRSSSIGTRTFSDLERDTDVEEADETEESPKMVLWVSLLALAVITVLVTFTAEWLVDSIDGITASGRITKEFVGVILLPMIGNAPDFMTAVTVSYKDKLMLSVGVAVGSSIQTSLLVTPLLIIIGWGLDKPFTLLFDKFEVIALVFTVISVNYVMQDGKSNWLEGVILMSLFFFLGLIFFCFAGSDLSPACT